MTGMTTPPEVLTGPRVVLRRWRADDSDVLCAAVAASMASLRDWMAWAGGDYGPAEAATYLDACAHDWTTGTAFAYAVTLGGTVVGSTDVRTSAVPGVFEIGYWLHVDHRGQGLSTEATELLVRQAFAMPEVERVLIRHDAANTASEGVPKRLGFTETARLAVPDAPTAAATTGVEVVWELRRADA
jgi:RimJ/RimL family protein N-acetyltransferase